MYIMQYYIMNKIDNNCERSSVRNMLITFSTYSKYIL